MVAAGDGRPSLRVAVGKKVPGHSRVQGDFALSLKRISSMAFQSSSAVHSGMPTGPSCSAPARVLTPRRQQIRESLPAPVPSRTGSCDGGGAWRTAQEGGDG